MKSLKFNDITYAYKECFRDDAFGGQSYTEFYPEGTRFSFLKKALFNISDHVSDVSISGEEIHKRMAASLNTAVIYRKRAEEINDGNIAIKPILK